MQDRADLNRQVQDDHIAINRFTASFGLGFLKALEVINRAAQAAERVQMLTGRLEDEGEKNKQYSYEHER